MDDQCDAAARHARERRGRRSARAQREPRVETGRGRTRADHDLFRKARGLRRQRGTDLRSREYALERLLRRVACEHAVDYFAGLGACQRRIEQTLQLPGGRELLGDPLHDPMPYQQSPQLLRQRARERLIDQPPDLGLRQELLRGRLDRAAPDASRDPCGIDGRASDGVGNRGPLVRPALVGCGAHRRAASSCPLADLRSGGRAASRGRAPPRRVPGTRRRSPTRRSRSGRST